MTLKVDPLKLLETCRGYIGTPFRHRGRSKWGLDCAGLVIRGLLDLGLDPFDLRVYGREPSKDGLRQAIQANMGLPVRGPLKPGDVVLMRFQTEPQHVGLVGDHPAGGLTLLHAFSGAGKVVEHSLDEDWKKLIIEAYRFESETE